MTAEVIIPLLAGFIGILTGAYIQYLSQRQFRSEDKQAKCLKAAAIVTRALDEFALACADRLAKTSLYEDSDGAAGARNLSIPAFPQLIEVVELSSLPGNFLSEYLALTVHRTLGEGQIEFWWDVDSFATPVAAKHQIGLLGHLASDLASRIRASTKLPEPNYVDYFWNFREVLADQHSKALQAIERERETS